MQSGLRETHSDPTQLTGRLSAAHPGVGRQGTALLEAVIALLLIGITLIGALDIQRETSRAMMSAAVAERDVRAASAFLDAVILWRREDLDRHVGTRREGPWSLTIDRRDSALYRVTVADSAGRRILLETMAYRASTP